MSITAHSAETAIKAASLLTDDSIYAIIHLPPNGFTAAAGILAHIGEAFSAVILDRHEVTLILPEDTLPDIQMRLRDHRISPTRYRLITMDVVIDYPVIGFIARISAALAAARINIMPYAAFERDHLLVPVEQIDSALTVLRNLQDSIRL
jgi:hypothetical protein